MNIRKLVEQKLYKMDPIVIEYDRRDENSDIIFQCPYMTTAVIASNLINNLVPGLVLTEPKINRFQDSSYYKIVVDSSARNRIGDIRNALHSCEIDTHARRS